MALQEKQLGQARENSTSAVSVYSPASSTTAIIKNIMVTNTSAAAADVSIYVDDDGTTYDETTAIMWESEISAGETITLDSFIAMNDSDGNLAYQSSVANALTITVFGAEVT